MAWFAPDFGGICVGFAVRLSGRQESAWVHVLHCTGAEGLRHSSEASGLGACCVPKPTSPDSAGADPRGVPLPIQPWRFIERDPTAVILETVISTDVAVQLRLTAAFDDGALILNLDARYHGTAPIPLQLGFRATFARDLFGDGVSMGLVRAPAEHVNERIIIPTNTALAPGEYELHARIENGMIPPGPPNDQGSPRRVRLIADLSDSYLLLYSPHPDGANALTLLACAPTSVAPPPGDARSSTGLSLTAIGTIGEVGGILS
ncbi:MAG: hypothetical protein M3Y58_19250 [Chloroflexota bacterium]|nr:hypothetical protein [Chloroflexota bacterium]